MITNWKRSSIRRQWIRQIADFIWLLYYSVNDIALGYRFFCHWCLSPESKKRKEYHHLTKCTSRIIEKREQGLCFYLPWLSVYVCIPTYFLWCKLDWHQSSSFFFFLMNYYLLCSVYIVYFWLVRSLSVSNNSSNLVNIALKMKWSFFFLMKK
jgi:hypothetical protein